MTIHKEIKDYTQEDKGLYIRRQEFCTRRSRIINKKIKDYNTQEDQALYTRRSRIKHMKMTFSYFPGMLENPAPAVKTSFKRNINLKKDIMIELTRSSLFRVVTPKGVFLTICYIVK